VPWVEAESAAGQNDTSKRFANLIGISTICCLPPGLRKYST
jgi:hypothetical protein